MLFITTWYPKFPIVPYNHLACFEPILLCNWVVYNSFIGFFIQNDQNHAVLNSYYYVYLCGICSNLAIDIFLSVPHVRTSPSASP